MTNKQLADYAEQQRTEVTDFFKGYVGEFPCATIGCEKIVEPKLFVAIALERIKASHKSSDFRANMIRIKKYKKYLEELCTQ